MLRYCSKITERVLYSTIKNVMSQMFTNFEQEQLSISLLGGSLEIRDLHIRKELFEDLSFPIVLSDGIVGRVNIDIVWRKIFTQEFVKITLDDVYVIFNTTDMKKWDVVMFEKGWKRVKANLLRQDEFMTFLKSSVASNFLRQIGHFFISKIQLEIRNINFRIENLLSQYMKRFVIGLSIDTISSRNCNEYWIPVCNSGGGGGPSAAAAEGEAEGETSRAASASGSQGWPSAAGGFRLDKKDQAMIGSIVDKYLGTMTSLPRRAAGLGDREGDSGGESGDDRREQAAILERVLRSSRTKASGGKVSSGARDFWSKLKKNTPLRWVWSNSARDRSTEESPVSLGWEEQRPPGLGGGEEGGGDWTNNDMIFPHPNGTGISREVVDGYIAAKEGKEIERYVREKLVQADILDKHEIFLKSFVIENFSVYIDEISPLGATGHQSWTSSAESESQIPDRINFLRSISAKESDTHHFIIYPHKIELRARLVPCIINYDENIYASALNDRFYILSQDEDNMVIPLISSYLIFDNLSIDITERQLKLLLDFLDYSVFLYGDFSAGSCPKDFENFPGEEPCIRYRLAWFEFLTGEKDRNNTEICSIEESYNAYSLIKLRNDVYKCLNYSIYHSVKSVLSLELDKSQDNLLSLPLFSIKDGEERNSGDHPFNNAPNKTSKPVPVNETDKISHHLAQYIVSKVVIGQNDHYSLSLNMGNGSQAGGDGRSEAQDAEIPLSQEEKRLISENDLLGRIKTKTRSLLSRSELPLEVVTFDLNSYLRSDKDETSRRSYHTSLFTVIFNSQNLTVNYSVSVGGDHAPLSRSRKSLRFNCLDLYFQYKLFTESKKSEITVAAENCYMVVHDDREVGMNSVNSSNCLLRIGPNIQGSQASDVAAFSQMTNHPILHRSSIYTGTSICNRRPYRMFPGHHGGGKMHEPCENIGGFWLTIRLNKNPFRTTPKVNINGKTYGEISVVGSYDVFERFLDPIVNHLSPKQRNNYLNKANQNFIKVIKKGQKLMAEFLNNGGAFYSFSDMHCPNYIYLNIDAKAKQLLFFPILNKDPNHEQLEKTYQNSSFANTAAATGGTSNRFSGIMEYKINKLSAHSGMYCIDCGEMLIETFQRNPAKKVGSTGDKFFIDNIKISFSNISLSFMEQVRVVDLYINKDLEQIGTGPYDEYLDTWDDLHGCGAVRSILKPQNWTFSVSKYMSSTLNVDGSFRQFLVNLEFSLKLADDTSVEINTTDMDLHNIAEIANYFFSFYSQYNFINYSQILVSSNVDEGESVGRALLGGGAEEDGRSGSVSSLGSAESKMADSVSKKIEFVCTIPDTRVVIKSDRLYRERQGMAIRELPVIRLNVSSIKLLILEGDKSRSGVYVSIADVCLSGGILNRNGRLLVPLFCPISDTFCSLSIKFSDLSNIDRYKDFTGILLSNSYMDIQINNPRFIVYWDLYGIILNWIITFYFRSIAVHLERKIDISNIKPILNSRIEDFPGTSPLDGLGSNVGSVQDQDRGQSDAEQFDLRDDRRGIGREGKDSIGGADREYIASSIIQFLSIINLKIQFKNAIAILPCTLSDPIQVVITETSSSSSSSSSAVSSASGQTRTNSGTGTLAETENSAVPSFKIDILKSLLAVISCDLTYTFSGESVFEIETRKDSHSRLKSSVMKSTFELFKGSIQFGRSLTPRYVVEALTRISKSYRVGARHGNATTGSSVGVSRFGSGVSNFTNRKGENKSVIGNGSVLTSPSANQGTGGGGNFQKLTCEPNVTNLVKSFLVPATEEAWQSLLEIENLVNSYQWQFNFDLGSGSENKIVSSLRFKMDFINNQLEASSGMEGVVLLYGFLETVEIKINTNDLLQLINVVDMYCSSIQSNLFVDLSNQGGQIVGLVDNQDTIPDMQSDYGSRYNVGSASGSYQTASSSTGGSSSMMNYLVYLFPSVFYSTVTSYSKFISQFKLEGLKIHYIPTNLTSNKDGVLIDVTETQLGLYVNDEAPDSNFLVKIFPFLSIFKEGSKRLMEEFEIRDKLLLIPRFSISSIPVLPILAKSKDVFFGFVLEFKKISVSIFNNQLMFYDNILEPFDVSLLSVCRGSHVNPQKITKEKVSPRLDVEITWINLTMTPEYVKYWLNCLDNFNEVYSSYYSRLASTNKLISRRVFPYNHALDGILSRDAKSRAGGGGSEPEEKFKSLSTRPLSGEWGDDHLFNLHNSVNNRQVTGGNLGSSNFVLYNDTGQTLAVLIPLFLDDTKSSKVGEGGGSEARNPEFQGPPAAEEGGGSVGRSGRKGGGSNLARRRSDRVGSERSLRESIFDRLLVRKKSVLDTSNLYSQESDMSSISNISKTTYNLYYVWRYLKPNHRISFSRDEYGNSYPVVVRIRILNDVFDLNNITMDKANMEVVYLALSERSGQTKVPLLIKTDIMDNHSFLVSISSRVFVSNNTSNIVRLLPSPKNVEEFLRCNFFIPPICTKPVLVPKYNNKFYETIYRKYVDKSYILSVLDEEINTIHDNNDYLSVLIHSNSLCKKINPEFFTLYLNPNTYTCMPMWTSIPVLHAGGKHEVFKYVPLRAVMNNVWLEMASRRRGEVSIRISEDGEGVSRSEFVLESERRMEEYLDVYAGLESSSESIMHSRCYRKLFTESVSGRKKSHFGSSMIQLVRRLCSRECGGVESNAEPETSGQFSLCSSVCEYSQRSARGGTGSFMLVVKLEIPIVIKNDLLIPVQLSFNRERYGKVSGSIEQIPNEREETQNNERASNSGSVVMGQAVGGGGEEGLSELVERVFSLNDPGRSSIHLKSNERILLESLPTCLSVGILDVSFGKFFGFYRSSQIQINYSSTGKELSKEILVPLRFSNGYKLMPRSELARIGGASAVITNGFLPSSTCINVIFENNRTDYVSKDFIPRQKQDLNYHMEEGIPGLDYRAGGVFSARTYQDSSQANSVLDVSTPWNGYFCRAYNTCKVRLSLYAPFWIKNRQHIPIYVLQKSQIFSRFRLGSNEFRILPTNNGKSDLGVALNPELSKKCHSPFVHIERANIVGTITVLSRRAFSQVPHSGGGSGHFGPSLNGQGAAIRDMMFGSNLGLKLGYCVTTISNFSKSPNFMINIYNKYVIVNYHNLPIWVRESSKFGSWIYIPPNISIPFHPLDSKDVSVVEITFLDPKIIEEYERRYNINLGSIPYKTLPLSIDNLYDIQVRLVSSLNNIPLLGQSQEEDGLPREIGNLHFTYILSSVSIYSINSSTSYQINVYPSQIPDFSIVNETPCSIFIRQVNTSCWNHFSPITDSNYALLDPFGEHVLEVVVGVSLRNLDLASTPTRRSHPLLHKRDHVHLGAGHSHNHHHHHGRSHISHRNSAFFSDFSSIPLYLYTDQTINVWYKHKSNLNLNKVLTHSRLFIPEYNSMLYIVMLIENGTRVINISFDNTLYKRRRNEIRAMNQSNSANKNSRLESAGTHTFGASPDHEERPPQELADPGRSLVNTLGAEGRGEAGPDHALVLNHSGKSIFKSLGNRLKKHRDKDDRSSNLYEDEEGGDEERGLETSILSGFASPGTAERTTHLDSFPAPPAATEEAAGASSELIKEPVPTETEMGAESGMNKIMAVSSFETELSQFSNSNLSRVSSGQNLFLLVDRIRPETRICFEVNIGCDGFGVSFLSNVNKEITYMSFQKMSFKLEKSKVNDQFHLRFRIMEFQLDNHITSSAENTIIRKATPNEFLRLSKLNVRGSGVGGRDVSPLDSADGGGSSSDRANYSEDEMNGVGDIYYYGVESLLSVGVVAALGEVIKKKSEIIRIHNKLLEYMTVGTREELDLSSREKKIRGILCMESFLDLQFSMVMNNTNDISSKYGSNGVIEIPYFYFWMYPLSIHLDIDTIREMVSILDLLINRILSPTEELDSTKSASLQSLPLVENLKKVSRYVYIQVLLMNPIQILCSTSKSTWNVSASQSENFTDYYNVMNSITKMGENEVIVRHVIPLGEEEEAGTCCGEGGFSLKSLLNYKIMGNFGSHYLNFNHELAVNHANILERVMSAGKLGGGLWKNSEEGREKPCKDAQRATGVVGSAGVGGGGIVESGGDGGGVSGIGQGQIQNNLTINKTGTEFLLNILQWLSSMPFSNVPIEFKGVINESMFLDSEKCLVQIGDLYRQQIFSHIGKIIGSIDLIGNPIDIYILVKEGLLASKYHFDLYKRATKLKEKIQENIQRRRIRKGELIAANNSNNMVDTLKGIDKRSGTHCFSVCDNLGGVGEKEETGEFWRNIEMTENCLSGKGDADLGGWLGPSSQGDGSGDKQDQKVRRGQKKRKDGNVSSDDDNDADGEDEKDGKRVLFQAEEQYQYLLDFCYDFDERRHDAVKTYDEEVEDFLKENKSLVLKSNAELMTKLVFFSTKEIMVGLHILVGTGIAVASQVVVRISSAILHLFEATCLLDQECLMSIWYGTPLFMSRYIADNPNNLIEGLITGSLRSLLILMSIFINFWQVPKKMSRQMGVGGVFLGIFLAFVRIVPAGFAAFLTLLYGISSGVVQSLRTKIPVRHIRTVRVICNGSPILPYNPNHSIATMIIGSLKLVNDVRESNVISFISFKGGGQTVGSSGLESNFDGIILNNKRPVVSSGIEKKFLIYKLLENKDDSNLHHYNGIIIFKESVSLLKSGKLVWMIPLINISRINLYMVVVSSASARSEDNNLILNKRRIKNMFYSKEKTRKRSTAAFESTLDVESHFLGIKKKESKAKDGRMKPAAAEFATFSSGGAGTGTNNDVLSSKRSFEFHLFVKPWSYLDDLSESGASQYSKFYFKTDGRRGGNWNSRFFSGNGRTTGLMGYGGGGVRRLCTGSNRGGKRTWLPLVRDVMFRVHRWKTQSMMSKGISLFSDKKFMKQLLLPKKAENVQVNKRFTIDERTFVNLKTNNRALNEAITITTADWSSRAAPIATSFNLTNNSFISVPTSSFSSLNLGQSGSSSSSFSAGNSDSDHQFQLSSRKQFSEKIIFTVEDKDDAIKIFSVLSKYVNSE